MNSQMLVWAAVPHNSDGVVFQIHVTRGLQRFHISRRVLEEVFDLEPRAMDARQLQLFYQCMDQILVRAGAKRTVGNQDTVALQATDFFATSKRESSSGTHAVSRSAR